jgi:hypothetical protein
MPVEKSSYPKTSRAAVCLLLGGLLVAMLGFPVANAQQQSPLPDTQVQEYRLYLPVLPRNSTSFKVFLSLLSAPLQGGSAQRPEQHSNVRLMPQRIGFVQRVGENLQLDGKPYTFIGTNVSYLAGPFFPEEKAEEIVAHLAESGVQVIRVWVEPWCDLERVARLVDLAGKYNVRLILTLQDFFGHKDGWWFKGKVESVDLPHIRNIVPLFANRPEILMWELMNEPTCPAEDANKSCWDAFVRWAAVTSSEIKRLDPNHLVSVGTQRAGFDEDAIEAFRRVHALDTIDIVSVHWGVDSLPEKELAIAHELGKPIYFGEVARRGLDESCQPLSNEVLQQRAEAIARSISRSREAGVDGYLLWQYAYGGVVLDGHNEYFCGVYDYFADDPAWQVIRSATSPPTK